MSEISNLIIAALALHRISVLMRDDVGPFEILYKFRKFIGVYFNDSNILAGKNEFAKWWSCINCHGLWIAAFMFVCYSINADISMAIFTILAISGLSSLIDYNLG